MIDYFQFAVWCGLVISQGVHLHLTAPCVFYGHNYWVSRWGDYSTNNIMASSLETINTYYNSVDSLCYKSEWYTFCLFRRVQVILNLIMNQNIIFLQILRNVCWAVCELSNSEHVTLTTHSSVNTIWKYYAIQILNIIQNLRVLMISYLRPSR